MAECILRHLHVSEKHNLLVRLVSYFVKYYSCPINIYPLLLGKACFITNLGLLVIGLIRFQESMGSSSNGISSTSITYKDKVEGEVAGSLGACLVINKKSC